MELPVGLIAHGQVQPGFFIYNALIMGEGVEAGLSVISSHAAFPQILRSPISVVARWMMVSLIHPPPNPQRAVISFCRCFVRGKEIKEPEDEAWELTREITSSRLSKYQNRHEGTEDLFLHHRIGKNLRCQGP